MPKIDEGKVVDQVAAIEDAIVDGRIAIAQRIWDVDDPTVAIVHVHDSSAETVDECIVEGKVGDADGLPIEIARVGFTDHITIGIGLRGDVTQAIGHADGITEDGTLSARTRLHDPHVDIFGVTTVCILLLAVSLVSFIIVAGGPLSDHGIIPFHPVVKVVDFLLAVIATREQR